MNIHHLELFYYVAKSGGVSAAARKIPYGIQQPAISAQIIQLEDSIGAALFHRRPFQLTPAGEELFRFIEPFFSGLPEMTRKLRGGGEVNLRIGANESIQRGYLPRQLKAMRRRFPELRFTLVRGRLDDIERGLLAQEIDIGVSPLLGQRPEGIRQQVMMHVPMALLVPEASPLTSPAMLWKRDRIAEPLIAGPGEDPVCRLFQSELQKRKVEWFPSMELNSQDLIARYVVEDFGIGLVLVEPGIPTPPGSRMMPLEGFPAIPYGVLWVGHLTPLQQAFFEEAQVLVDELASAVAPPARRARPSKRRDAETPRTQRVLKTPRP